MMLPEILKIPPPPHKKKEKENNETLSTGIAPLPLPSFTKQKNQNNIYMCYYDGMFLARTR